MIFSNVLGRILGQALLLLPNFMVSITAAHKLDTVPLAAFFVAWTIESQWIAGVRSILVPAIILRSGRPSITALLGCLSALALIPGFVMLSICLAGGLDIASAVAVSLTPLVLGALDCSRSLLAKSAEQRMRLFMVDAAPITGALVLVGCAQLLGVEYGLAVAAFGLLLGGLAGLNVALGGRARVPGDLEPMRNWLRERRLLLITGGQEWLVFASVGLLSITVINAIAGPQAVAGIRLAETLLAPLGVVVLAVPVVLAPVLQNFSGNSLRWPSSLSLSVALLMSCGIIWVTVLLVVPDSWVGLLVGGHVVDARHALAGLGIGAVASLGAAVFSLVLKRRNELKTLRRVRWIELLIAVPCVAAGSFFGSVTSAAAGVSVLQVIGATGLVVAERLGGSRFRGRHAAVRSGRKEQS